MSNNSNLRELHGKRAIGYNIGYFGIFLSNMLISVFIFQFYVYTVNLSSILASVGLFLQLILGAIFSILFGVVIDNKRPGKRGKRRIFLLYGLPFWALTGLLLWMPPWYCPEGNPFYLPVAIYYWALLILNAFFGNMMLVAHGSMLPEQSQTTENRKKIATIGTILVIIASFIGMLLPLIIQSLLADPENVKWWQDSGKTIILLMPYVGGLVVLVGLVSILITYFSVDESFLNDCEFDESSKKSLKKFFREMKRPAKDKKFKNFIKASFFIQFAGRAIALVLMPFLIYVLIFQGIQFFIYMAVSVICKLVWFYIWNRVFKKCDMIKAYSFCLLSTVIASGFELIYLLNFLSFELKVALFFVTYGTVLGSMYALGLFQGPLISALIDEAALKIIEKESNAVVSEISGAYSGLNIFMMTIGQGIASITIGFMLMGDNLENPVIITLILASVGIAYLFALLCIIRIKLEKK